MTTAMETWMRGRCFAVVPGGKMGGRCGSHFHGRFDRDGRRFTCSRHARHEAALAAEWKAGAAARAERDDRDAREMAVRETLREHLRALDAAGAEALMTMLGLAPPAKCRTCGEWEPASHDCPDGGA